MEDKMQKLEQLYEGKAKKVFKTDDPDVLIVDYKDDATAFNGEKKGTIVGKGVINNKMSNRVHQLLEEKGVPTHYIQELSDRKWRSYRLKLLSETWPPEAFPRDSVCRRELPLNSPPWSSVIRMTNWAIL